MSYVGRGFHGKGNETLKDTAKVLSQYVDIVMLRTSSHKHLEEFGKYLDIPIINGLSEQSHPCQIMSDILTYEESNGSITGKTISWIGDGNNNMSNSFIEAAVKFKFNLNIGCPKIYRPPKFVINWVKKNRRKINIFEDPKKAIKNADVVFSDKVISMNDKVNKTKKIKDFKNYFIDASLMKYANKNAIFLHCLPRGNEVSEDVFLGKQSKVWQQALNRTHVQKSILLYCFEKLR